ncbi:MAG TPA: hypothetical protein VF773_20315 [Verrucomicrobiae bacterium]
MKIGQVVKADDRINALFGRSSATFLNRGCSQANIMNKMVGLVGCVVCLAIGYVAGREHAKSEMRREANAALQRSEAAAAENLKVAEKSAKKGACINHLRQIDGAKEQWALEKRRKAGDAVEAADISPYLVRDAIPVCPAGGQYSLGNIGQLPTCSENGHALGAL